MKVPLSWLKEYVEFEDTPEGLAERLTFAGVEVEGIARRGGGAAGVVVGEIRALEKHPNADKLTVCRVADGSGSERVVVCGAPNAAVGGKYPFAPAGTRLPNGLLLERRKVRGVWSEGMLCAEDELGLSDSHEGLLELDGAWVPGTPLAEVLGPPETILELAVTPNRPDCLCLLGIAREVAALYGTRLRMPEVRMVESPPAVETLARVTVEDLADCPRYTARVLQSVKVGPSPAWMRRRLEAAGVRAINNIVDITNYVMLECGQPLHAFDRQLLAGAHILVRHPRPGEKLTTLDGVERVLEPAMLVIADTEKPLAVAGVMGGEHSGIRPETTEVLLESATFRPAAIRATSRKLGLLSESAYRFMRGVDVELAEWASRRAAALMVELAGAALRQGVIDVREPAPPRRTVVCRPARLNALLGLSADHNQIARTFEALELEVRHSTPERIEVTPPSFRGDLIREADLIEEYARLHLSDLPAVRPQAAIVPEAEDSAALHRSRLAEILVGLGLQQIMNYSFLAEGLLDRFNPEGAARRVKLLNPLTADHTVMRDALVPQLVETIGLNVSRQVKTAAFFETGRVFRLSQAGTPEEVEHLAIGLYGPVGRTGLDQFRPVEPLEMFLWIKGIWEQLAAALKLADAGLRPADPPWGQPGAGLAVLTAGGEIGWLGLLMPEIAREWRMNEPVGLLEVTVAPLLKDLDRRTPPVPPPSHPSIRRDVALIVAAEISHARVLEAARTAAPPELEKIELFDIFEGPALGAGRKSMAYAFTYRAPNRTLTDEEANAFQAKVNEALRTQLPAEIREK